MPGRAVTAPPPPRAASLLHSSVRAQQRDAAGPDKFLGTGTPLDPARCGSAPSVPQLPHPTCPHLFLRFQRLWVHLVHEDILIADVVIPFVQHIVHTAVVTGL